MDRIEIFVKAALGQRTLLFDDFYEQWKRTHQPLNALEYIKAEELYFTELGSTLRRLIKEESQWRTRMKT